MGSDFRFGAFEVDLRAHELRKKGLRVRLAEQPFQVLAMLLEDPGEVVTRDELRRRLWPADTFVDFDHSLNNAINRLRSALGDPVGTPLLIETLPRQGYRFVGRVERLHRQDATPPKPQRPPSLHLAGRRRLVAAGAVLALVAAGALFSWMRAGRPQSPAPVVMLAVLPFENLTGDPEQEYLCDGLTEEMITQIATLQPRRLGVIARTSSMHYRATRKRLEEVAHELGVDYVLEGSVRRSANRLRVSAQLIRVRDRTHVWAESFDRNVTDILDVERQVARAVAREVQLVLPPPQQARLRREPAADSEAHHLYIKGRYLANKGLEPSLSGALVQFERAISKDPRFAPAYAGRAVCYTRMSTFYMPPTEAMPLAREAALEALELDAELSEAHTALGVVKLFYDWDHPGAEAELGRAIELNPSSADAHAWYGYYLGSLGRYEEALQKTRRALALDPLSGVRHADLQWQLLLARRYDEVVEEGRRALELEPHMALAHLNSGMAYALKGDFDGAVAELENAVRLDESSMMKLGLAYAYAVSGRAGEARELLDEMTALSERRYICAFEMAVAQGALGDRDRAFEWLRRAIDERSDCIPWLNVEPMLDTLRDDPRFAALVRQAGFKR